MDKIYIVKVNADMTEGRGPMIMAKNSGFFTNEDEAWKFADTLYGVMGRKPDKSWRNEKYQDVKVETIFAHNGDYFIVKNRLIAQKNQIEFELDQLDKTFLYKDSL